jgi:hypothetical protein
MDNKINVRAIDLNNIGINLRANWQIFYLIMLLSSLSFAAANVWEFVNPWPQSEDLRDVFLYNGNNHDCRW